MSVDFVTVGATVLCGAGVIEASGQKVVTDVTVSVVTAPGWHAVLSGEQEVIV